MTKKDQRKLLVDEWPKASKEDRSALIKAVEKASKLGLFGDSMQGIQGRKAVAG